MKILALLLMTAIHGKTFEVVTVAPNVHTVVWNNVLDDPVVIGNSTFIINDEDVIVVDSGISDTSAKAIIAEIRKRTGKPVSLVINTHWHDDHVLGNRAFREAWPGVEFAGHAATREDFLKLDVPMLEDGLKSVPKIIADLEAKEATPQREKTLARLRGMQSVYSETAGKYVPPALLLTADTTIVRGARTIELRFLGLGNTRGDLVVWLPQERIAISGDLAITPSPFALGSNISDWLVTLDRLAALDAVVYVPGHGPVQREKTFLADLQALLRDVRDQVHAGAKAGRSVDDLKKSVVVTPRKGSVYEKAPEHPFFEIFFRQPAVERAFAETAK